MVLEDLACCDVVHFYISAIGSTTVVANNPGDLWYGVSEAEGVAATPLADVNPWRGAFFLDRGIFTTVVYRALTS